MTYNHTPRAWQVDRDHQTRTATDPITICAGSPDIAETWQTVAVVSGCGELGEQERDANARLIAAAPELLEALQELEQRLDYTKSGAFSYDDRAECLGLARAAITKARGES